LPPTASRERAIFARLQKELSSRKGGAVNIGGAKKEKKGGSHVRGREEGLRRGGRIGKKDLRDDHHHYL